MQGPAGRLSLRTGVPWGVGHAGSGTGAGRLALVGLATVSLTGATYARCAGRGGNQRPGCHASGAYTSAYRRSYSYSYSHRYSCGYGRGHACSLAYAYVNTYPDQRCATWVQPGDNLNTIAASFGVTVEVIIVANDIADPALIRVGAELIIPTTAALTPTPTRTTRRYVVQDGDNLSTIAASFGVTVDAIIAANDITDTALIRVGEELIIPTTSTSALAPTPTLTTRRYVVQAGDSVNAIAASFGGDRRGHRRCQRHNGPHTPQGGRRAHHSGRYTLASLRRRGPWLEERPCAGYYVQSKVS